MFEDLPGNVNAWSITGRAINLPSYYDMSEADIGRVAATLLDVAARRFGQAHPTALLTG
ncbi:UNVERIFIED_ORG: dTDP-4-amino-4,6-dideoxygalactose transaminase [Rhizobium esperanzae]|jgi:perosamine synthetase|nr:MULTISPECIES: hypothetical protein [Rhizobium]